MKTTLVRLSQQNSSADKKRRKEFRWGVWDQSRGHYCALPDRLQRTTAQTTEWYLAAALADEWGAGFEVRELRGVR